MQREQIDDLIVQLIVVKEFSKDIHYTCHGESFYAKHLLVDKFDFDDSSFSLSRGIRTSVPLPISAEKAENRPSAVEITFDFSAIAQ